VFLCAVPLVKLQTTTEGEGPLAVGYPAPWGVKAYPPLCPLTSPKCSAYAGILINNTVTDAVDAAHTDGLVYYEIRKK
jgi:hypothetical protein